MSPGLQHHCPACLRGCSTTVSESKAALIDFMNDLGQNSVLFGNIRDRDLTVPG